jgi:hypothetical protein
VSAERIAEIDRLIGHWRTILAVARNKVAQAATQENIDSVTYAEGKINQYLDQRLALTGRPLEVPPQCHSGACTQTKSSFGTQTWLCPECDFRECVGCRQRVHSFTVVDCLHCGFVIGAPKSADDELD